MPETIDPDRWLERVNHQTFTRTVQADGGVTINRQEYYLNRQLAARPHHERTRRDAVWLCPRYFSPR